MRKLTVLVAVTGLMVLALAAAAMPLGQGDAQGPSVFPGNRSIEVPGRGRSPLAGLIQEPAITSASDSISVEGAAATFSAPLQEP